MSVHLLHRYISADLAQFFQETRPAFPAGIILPGWFNAVESAPTGWSLKAGGAAGTAYIRISTSAGGDAVDTELSGTKAYFNLAAAGAHSGNWVNFEAGAGGAGTGSQAAHDHGGVAVSGSWHYTDRIQNVGLVCDADTDILPWKAHLLTYDTRDLGTLYGMTHRPATYGANGALWAMIKPSAQGGSAIAAQVAHSASEVHTFTIPQQGAHNHGGQLGGPNSGSKGCVRCVTAKGAHSHEGTFTATVRRNVFDAYFNFWHKGSDMNIRAIPRPCALWAGSIASIPMDWRVMDEIGPYRWFGAAKAISWGGQQYGTGNTAYVLNQPAATNNSGAHAHYEDWVDQERTGGYHSDTTGNHSHALSFPSQPFSPYRRSFYPIQRLW